MQAVILAGGAGKRLDPYTSVLPKPLIPVGTMPIIEVLLRRIAVQGVSEAILCTGHLGGLIRAYLDEVPDLPITLVYRRDEGPTGTAGPLSGLSDLLEPHYLVINGDVLTDLDVGRLMQAHLDAGAAMTIATRLLKMTIRYGVIEAEANGAVSGIAEKPTLGVEISAGVYVHARDAIAPILAANSGALDIPDLLKMALAAHLPVHAERTEGRWFDIGEESDLRAAREAFSSDPAGFLGGASGTLREG